MKNRPPDHCAHVASFYAMCADTLAFKPSYIMYYSYFRSYAQIASTIDFEAAIRHLKSAEKYARLALKFWKKSGAYCQPIEQAALSV